MWIIKPRLHVVKKLFCVIVIKAVVHIGTHILAFDAERIVKSVYFSLCYAVQYFVKEI